MTSRRHLLELAAAAAAAAALPGPPVAAGAPGAGPIIDVHMHAYPAALRFAGPIVNPISGAKSPILTGADHMAACIAEMRRHGVVGGVVSGGDGDRLQAALDWREQDPERFLAGAGIRGSQDTPLPPIDLLREAFSARRLAVLGEVTAQYAGLSLSDPAYEPYLALAEELDVPVALHTGTMPEGASFDPCCRAARARLGNPGLIEEALNRHPKLRVNVMHLGWPYLDDTLAMLMLYPNVNVDTGAVSWLLPRRRFHDSLRTLVEAGFGKRIMFGSDHMYWPDAIGLAIEGVATAGFLTRAQRRDIFHDNATRFYRWSGRHADGGADQP